MRVWWMVDDGCQDRKKIFSYQETYWFLLSSPKFSNFGGEWLLCMFFGAATADCNVIAAGSVAIGLSTECVALHFTLSYNGNIILY